MYCVCIHFRKEETTMGAVSDVHIVLYLKYDLRR